MSGHVTSVVLVGVLGQPVVATARVLAEAALQAGLDVSLSECPAKALQGGSIAAYVRMGEEVRSPLVGDGGADVLVAFEQIEALRAAHLLSPDGFAVVNERLVPTWRMRARLDPAPPDVTARLMAVTPRVVGVRAEALVRRADDALLLGFALLGVVSSLLPVSREAFDAALASTGPGLEARRHALSRGRQLFEALPAHLTAAPRRETG
ncbi:MAG TPA: 2-oxoacid:acceptor oxidoreductase family protein [Anaeromyxobacteraceae bacterium]